MVRLRMAYLVILSAAVLNATSAKGQDTCGEILKNGIWEYKSTTSSDMQASSFLTWFCTKEFKSFQEARDAAVGLTLPIEGIPVSLNGKYRDSQWEEYRNEACSMSSGTYDHLSEFTSFASSASVAVVKAWESCITRIGTFAWLATTPNPKAFALQIRRNTDLGAPTFTVQQVSVTSGSLNCSPSLKSAKNKKFTGSASFLCERADATVGFTLLPIVKNLTPPFGPLTVPAYVPLPPGKQSPAISLKVFAVESAVAAHPEAEVKVAQGYKVVGCGARVNWSGAGNLLTALYPNGAAQSCIARSKDHILSSPASISAWAIGLYDPQNEWEVTIFSQSTGATAHPRGSVTVPTGWAMTGGGAQLNYGSYGSLLTANFPASHDTWEARGKDHEWSDPSSMTVYAIGIRPRNGTSAPRVLAFSRTSGVTAHPRASVALNPPSDFLLTSGGAMADWRGAGSLLTQSSPTDDGAGWEAASKDHRLSDPASLTVWVLGIQKPNSTIFLH